MIKVAGVVGAGCRTHRGRSCIPPTLHTPLQLQPDMDMQMKQKPAHLGGQSAAELEPSDPSVEAAPPIVASEGRGFFRQHCKVFLGIIVGVRRVQFCTSYIRNEPLRCC